MPTHELLEGQFTADEAQDIADTVCDAVANQQHITMPVRWAIEEAIKDAFGHPDHEDE